MFFWGLHCVLQHLELVKYMGMSGLAGRGVQMAVRKEIHIPLQYCFGSFVTTCDIYAQPEEKKHTIVFREGFQ